MAQIVLAGEAQCIVCGCTDSQACEGGCYWIEVNYALGKGLCSSCLVDEDEESAA